MAELTSTKPYLLRAIHEWCLDNYLTPHLLVVVNRQTIVPLAYVKQGEIVLNLSYAATKNLLIQNEQITFSARFSGVSHDLYIPINAVKGVFAKENGQGMFFEINQDSSQPHLEGGIDSKLPNTQDDHHKNRADSIVKQGNPKKPTLKLVK